MGVIVVCPSDGPFDFSSPCVRLTWGAFLPAGLVFLLCLFSLRLPVQVPGWLKGWENVKEVFRTFLTLEEAESLDVVDKDQGNGNEVQGEEMAKPQPPRASLSTPVVLILSLGLAETLCWLSLASYRFISRSSSSKWLSLCSLLIALTWFYTVLRPVLRKRFAHSNSLTAPLDLFALYTLLFACAVVRLAGVPYDRAVFGSAWPGVQLPDLVAMILDLCVCLILLGVVGWMPLVLPSEKVRKEDIGATVSPEDYTSVWGWITFHWVYPLVQKGRYATLNENDVWMLSPTNRSRPLFAKFIAIRRSKLLWHILAANSFDILIDFLLTVVSVCFNYAGPFFLKRILDAIDLQTPDPRARANAYVYALLAFLCSVAKAQADVQHLWFGRRAATRMRSQLMAAIYDKALKRRDFSGVVNKENQEKKIAGKSDEGKKKKENKKEKEKEKTDDPKAGADIGKIVNLMAGDANRISQTVTAMYYIYGAPFELLIAGVFLYQLLGLSAFAGFLVLLAGWPLNSFLARRSIRIQKGLLAARDARMAVLNEILAGVKFIKFFAWEDRWIARALGMRAKELEWLLKSRVNSVLFGLLWTCAPIGVSIVSFWVFVASGKELTVSIAFTSIALFNMVRAPLNVIPAWIVQILQSGVALNRIAVYLNEDEVSPQVSSLKHDADASLRPQEQQDEGLGIENGSFKWNEVEPAEAGETNSKGSGKGKSPSPPPSSSPTASSSPEIEGDETATAVDADDVVTSMTQDTQDHKFELRDITVRFPEGKMTLVTGPTASGKTALLMALLGEMTILPSIPPGRLIMRKSPFHKDSSGNAFAISYAAQSPWLRHQSIRDNILFGAPFDPVRYNAVVEACALLPDLQVLEDGDTTEIGARGVSLSGGQKARVALARAVYATTKWVLLDDPLSAVDSHTARFLYERLLCGPLLANRTIILVTHHVDLVLPGAHYLVRMLDGRIDAQGTVEELRARGALEGIKHDIEVEVQQQHAEEAQRQVQEEQRDVIDPAVEIATGGGGDGNDGPGKKPRKLVKDEHRETGGVKWEIYKSYLRASSYWIWVFLASLVVVSQLLGVGEKIWVMIWGEAYKEDASSTTLSLFSILPFFSPKSDHEAQIDGFQASHYHHRIIATTTLRPSSRFGINWPRAADHPFFYIGVYAAIGLANALISVCSSVAQYTGAFRASRILFKQLLVTVIRATFRFHDTTPQGRMLNRFGKDVETIDSSLASSLQAVNSSLATFFASIILVAAVFPWFLFPAIFIGLGYRELAIGYLNTGRDLRRMESNSRSPIFSDFGELLEGIVTVRAFSAERRFLDNLHRKIDMTTKMWWSFWMTNRWLLLNFDVLGAIAVLITMLFSIATLADGAGLAGVCITSAMAFTTSVYWACRFWTALELDLNSVERVVEYLELPQEPPTIIESSRVPAYWPSSSNKDSLVVVEDLVVKYAPDLPAVLQNVSFTLRAGERVGLLGRTGSGKSTLAMSLLRFVDPTSGHIIIDGIDISTIGIHDLRSRLTFIPQDATLFSGTLRDNLDPFNEHTDSECLDVLQRVQMITDSHQASASTSRASSRPGSIHNLEREETVDTNSIATAATEVEQKTTVTLDTQVSAGGTNFSHGQRQLVAMARALLRRSSVIVFDEATSSIDFATDAKIQTTIREEFTSSLLLTVAHRLRTVIDYDQLIVLDKGQIVEFDTPWNLIQKESGIFRDMCMKSGSYSELEAAAKAKAEGDKSL